jgi:hypothetical protein
MRQTRPLQKWLLVIAAGVGALLMLVVQQFGQLQAGRNPLLFLRSDFWHDQLGYLAIVSDVANGHFDNSEPVTTTGISHYPRLYYSFVGVVARVFGLPSVVSWNLVSLVLQFLAALAVGLLLGVLSRRWWMGFAAPLPFVTGAFAYAMSGEGAWYTLLKGHAVLWGPFGVLFSSNAETAGLCVGIIALCAVIWVWRGSARPGLRWGVTIAASATVGMLSSFQTYSFLSLTYLLVFGAATAGVLAARRRLVLAIVSIVLVLVVFVVGPLLAARAGQLPTLVFGMLPAVPGLVAAIFRSKGMVAVAGVAAVAAALPQVLYTMLGILGGDPFLTYRTASNSYLGVVSWQALLGASVVIVALVGVLITAAVARDRLSVVISTTALVAFPLLTVNDVWGANAEPYRFWIEGIFLGGVIAVVGMARLAAVLWPLPRELSASRPRARILFITVACISGLMWTASLPDLVNAYRDEQFQAVWDPYTERETAIMDLARQATTDPADGLLTTERCIDIRTTKANSGAPIANYHLGMAWPEDREAIDSVIAAQDADQLDETAMRASGTAWVLTDSNCDSSWQTKYADRLTHEASVDYDVAPGGELVGEGRFAAGTILLQAESGTITLWKLAED